MRRASAVALSEMLRQLNRRGVRNIGLVGGTVAWARDGKFGMAFDCQIDPSGARRPVGTGKINTNVPDFLRQHRPR